ncbi:hypothetical protein ANCCAN_04702 [Ancylostoma caninum]|uniref:Uncharacterized protein n=1 Tax=Ancylostoma caninum TaxID=29170 RepID=A0A368H1K3_ANCCA|nr:hypothetical protein ANCCAN_04702 [Ancylostoma caninum]
MADTESDGGGSSTESSSVNGEVEHRRRIEKRLMGVPLFSLFSRIFLILAKSS